MAWTRKRRRRTFKRRRTGKKRRTAAIAKVVRRIKPSEQKWTNVAVAPIATGATNATQVLLNWAAPAQGVTRITRLGNEIMVRSCEFRGTVIGQNADPPPAKVRFVMFIEKVPGTTPLTPAILNAGPGIQTSMFADSDTTGANSWISMMNPDSVPSRYRILRDFVIKFDIQSETTVTANPKVVYWRKKIVFKNGVKVKFNDFSNAGNPIQVDRNLFWIFVCCDQAGANAPNVEWDLLTRFTDS